MQEGASIPVAFPTTPSISLPNKSVYRSDEVIPDYFKVLKWSFIPIVVLTGIWLFEIHVLQNPRRFIGNPAEFASRVFGFSHYVVGLMFMMSSRRMRRLDGWLWFVGLLAVAIFVAVLFSNFGGRLNPILVIFYFLFFMVHGFRDIVFFYQPVTDDRNLEQTRAAILRRVQACVLLFLMYVLVPVYFYYRSLRPKTYAPDLQNQIDALMPYLKAVMYLSWVLIPIFVFGIIRRLGRFPGGAWGFAQDNRPILLVLLFSVLIILFSSLLGSWIYNLLILSHFVGWYFYASRRLATIPRQSTRADGWWQWIRGSVAGFQRLHLIAAAIFFVIILTNYFLFSGVVDTLLSANAFYYWTVIHVTVSFAPRA